MVAFNIIPTAIVDDTTYAASVPLTSTEAVLGDAIEVAAIIPTTFNEAISAVIQLSINGLVVGNTTYIVLQMDMGDDVWVDMNWLVWTGNQGTAIFVFSNGIAGANVFQQTRGVGQPPTPQAVGSNQMTLGGRLRFVGKASFVGGSSSLAGVTTSVSATIRYRLQALR